MSEHRLRPPNYRGATFGLGVSALLVGMASPSADAGPMLILVGLIFVTAAFTEAN